MNGSRKRFIRGGRWTWLGVTTLVLVMPCVVWFTIHAAVGVPVAVEAAVPEPRRLTVLTTPLKAETGYRVRRYFTGQIEPARSAAVGFELDGLLAAVAVDEGERVQVGQELAKLDRARLDARREELRAALESARARLALATFTHRRIQGLVERKHASAQELDEARENRRGLRAEVALARARLASVAVELDKTRLRAPFDAVVVKRLVDEGRMVSTGTPVLELQELVAPRARVGVSPALAEMLAPSQRHRLGVNGRAVEGVIRTVLPLRRGITRSVEVILDLETAPLAMRSGDLIRMMLSRPVEARGFWVPLDALTEGQRGTWSVYVAGAGHGIDDSRRRIERRSIEVLHQQADRVYVQGALEPGELLVGAGPHWVVPGQPVLSVDSAVRLVALGAAR